MKTVNGSCFTHQIHDDYSVFEPAPEVDELTRELIEESLGILNLEFDHPFGIIYPRWTRASIDLLAARQLMQTLVPHLVAAANVTDHPDTVRIIDFEKTVVDFFPIETFSTLEEATDWLLEEIQKQRMMAC